MDRAGSERDAAIQLYEDAERDYLASLRAAAANPKLAQAAERVRAAAEAWCAAAYGEFFAERATQGGTVRPVIELEIDAERAEMLKELWRDIGAAHSEARG